MKSRLIPQALALLEQPTSQCVDWPGACDSGGYGTVSCGGKTYCAHRFFYELKVGPIPPGMTIDHECWNTRCINPRHMSLMSMRDNRERQRAALKLARLRGELNEASAAEQQAEQAALAWRDDAQQARDDASSPYGPRDRW